MGCDSKELMVVLSTCKLQAGRDCIDKRLTLPQATDMRDSLAKIIYASLFNWLVEQINTSLEVGMITKRTRTDQATAIVAELCDNCREVPDEVKKLINPVFGRVDNFSKDFKMLVKASGVHAYMETSMDSLKKIALFLYPRLL
ncbi:hypothetical protein YC2023_096201 [Brassica napus]